MDKDGLTGLMCRVEFQQVVGWHLRAGGTGALLLASFDNARIVNERLGVAVLDECLKHVGKLVEQAAVGCNVARVAGDGIGVFVQDATAAGPLAEQIRAAVEQDERLSHVRQMLANSPWQPVLTVSVGVTVLKEGQDLDSALDAMHEAVKRAKERGRNRLAQA
jgi:diguanylate cyclase (GGDEF)-like protein